MTRKPAQLAGLSDIHDFLQRVARVLSDWRPPFPGYHLYYPSRHHASPAFSLLVEALRFKEH
jgi:DNA-binding transcriptional LysR family regulator